MRIFCILALCVLPSAAQTTTTPPATTTTPFAGTWAELTDGKNTTASLRSLAEADDGTLIAVGDKGLVQISNDKGVTWSKQETLNIDGEDQTTPSNFYDIINSDGRLVIVGSPPTVKDYAVILISDDNGVTWVNKFPDGVIGHFGLRAVVSQLGELTAVGASGGAVESLDNGDTWAQIKSGNTKGYLAAAADDSELVVAVGIGGAIMLRTIDDDGNSVWATETSGTTNNLWGVTYDGTNFVAVGEKGTVVTSTDGITWALHSVPAVGGELPFFTDVTSVSGVLLTSGTSTSGFLSSVDEGVTWVTVKVTPYGTTKIAAGAMQDLAITSTGIFSVGLKGEVWFSDDSYEVWIANAGLTGANALATADPDGDGLPNLTEFVLGLNPKVRATSAEKALLPHITNTAGAVAAVFTLPTKLPKGITATIERATTLSSATTSFTTFATLDATGIWKLTTAVTPSPITTVPGTDGKSVTTVALGTGTTTGVGFFRLRFSR